MARHYTLTPELVAAHAGGPVVCLDPSAAGRTFRAYSRRPGPERNRSASAMLAGLRGEVLDTRIVRAEPEAPQNDVLVVEIVGPIEQRAGQHEPSGSWVDGHDAIYERLAAAFEVGDVVLVIDSPGGAVAGGPENIRRAQEMKAKHGRRCIVHTEAMCASMALWWALAIGDEMYVSPDGRAGSVGARGMLGSITGALAKDGIVIEIVEDPEGKAAGAPERPIDDEARQRAQRDVTAAADMFRDAVCTSAVGKRNGLTPDALKSMRGDMYQGARAKAMGLVDDVASLEDVLGYALATAGEGATAMADENDEKKDKPGDGPEGAEPMKCTRCGEEPGKDARYCAKCGEKMPDGPDGEEPPPSSRREPHPEPDKDDKEGAAALAGLSTPALRTALVSATRTLDAVAKIVGAKSHAEIVGAVQATAKDAGNALRYRRERDTERERSATAERKDLCMRLIACDVEGWRRGDLFADASGNVFADVIRSMPVAHLRGMVERFEKSRAERSPFEPPRESREKAEAAEEQNKQAATPTVALPSGEPTEAQIAAAMNLPAVKQVAAQTGRDPKVVAKAHLKAMAQNGAMAR